MMNPVIFREYDIRGVYKTDFDEDFAKTLGWAVVSFIRGKNPSAHITLTVGHDARLSSAPLAAAITEGILSSGADVIRLGLVTTPISYFSTFTIPNVSGAIMITGSHNPPEYNGFKISVGTSTIYGQDIQTLHKIILSGLNQTGRGIAKDHDIFPAYIERYKKEFGHLREVPVVLDCGNGAAGCIARRLFESVGLKPKILFEKPDGTFPNHHPDPTVEKYMSSLITEVHRENAVVGIGFDGDADRIGVVDETGRLLYGDELMVLIARDILKLHSGQTIIGDVKCSDRLYDDIRRHGGRPLMWKTGHSLIKQKVKEEKAPFGGEMSGHVFFADRNYGYDDALYASLRVVEILGRTGRKPGELLADLPSAHNTPEIRIDTTEEKKRSTVEHLKSVYSAPSNRYKINLTDGIRISFENGWALARPSNTQPVLVLRFESSTANGLSEIQKEIEGHIRSFL